LAHHRCKKTFLSSLISDINRAYVLGWIKQGGIRTSLDTKLRTAQAALDSGDVSTARNVMRLILETNAQTGKELTAECAALLAIYSQVFINVIR
jgi:hypothetical protein